MMGAAPSATAGSQGADSDTAEGFSILDLFSLRRPRDLPAGLSSAARSFGNGIVSGSAALVVCPLQSVRRPEVFDKTDDTQTSPRQLRRVVAGDIVRGTTAGVAGAVILPALAVSVAGYQVARGALNSFGGLAQHSKGSTWDQAQRKWVSNTPRNNAASNNR
eukprot:GHVT01024932.1.p1 GENE.GHVT01024932.1~~GHVT01024932.1.p1  ORF type:complete len:176 (-),score=22.69 GHVT01024932.1:115-600(-)